MKRKSILPLFEELYNAPTFIEIADEIDAWMFDGSDTPQNKWEKLYDSVAVDISDAIMLEV